MNKWNIFLIWFMGCGLAFAITVPCMDENQLHVLQDFREAIWWSLTLAKIVVNFLYMFLVGL